jgi:hypothetical protein
VLVIIENVLNEELNKIVKEHFFNPSSIKEMWIDGNLNFFKEKNSPLSNCLVQAANYFNLSNMVGCELWHHNGTNVGWHIDKDEKEFKNSGLIKTPICSIVYYASIENLNGGNFITETYSIKPITNRQLIFSPNILHSVENFTGTRISIAINPWSYKPLAHI